MNFEYWLRIKIMSLSIMMLSEKRERKVYFRFENDDVGICGGCIGVESSKSLIVGFLIPWRVI